jgi:UDP-N-acetylmuramoyl-L-alanyl-D-glutamate--2,6-diaminopimelate ligase
MKVDSPGSIGVTADPRKVRPGMIYVDLSNKKNKRQIYEAYTNGASLIFTPFNISDPELPVIKVRSTRDTLYMLIDRYFGKQEHQPKLVGVLGDGDKTVLVEMIQRILSRNNSIENLNNLSRGSMGNLHNIDEFFEAFSDMHKPGLDIIPITIDTNSSSIFYFANMNIDCAIMTDRSSLQSNCEGRSIKDYLSGLAEKKAIILNNDEYYGLKTTEEYRGIGCITYGLNKKAVVTASSIDVDEVACFNYCVQRSFHTRSGGRVEPFEIPVRLNALGTYSIYNALAAITCGLYYDNDIAMIKDSVESYKAPARHFQKIYDGEFTVIDNYCSSIQDYTAAFDSMQILNYDNLILIISVSQDQSLAFHEEKARLITEWTKILKCREVILTSCMDGNNQIAEFPMKSIRIYKKIFKENDSLFRYYHLLQHSIERGLSVIGKRGLMVMLGSEEMNIAHKLLQRQLRPITDIKH